MKLSAKSALHFDRRQSAGKEPAALRRTPPDHRTNLHSRRLECPASHSNICVAYIYEAAAMPPAILPYMNVQPAIKSFIDSQPEPKRSELLDLHQHILQVKPGSKLWFDNGINEEGKTVTNPTIGYGLQTIKYADGKTKEFFQIGLSANATGLSVYILGIEDKTFLSKTYGEKLGKAKVTGYCIRFKKLKDIDVNTLMDAIQYGMEHT